MKVGALKRLMAVPAKRLMAVSALVASGALCVGLAMSQVLAPAPTATSLAALTAGAPGDAAKPAAAKPATDKATTAKPTTVSPLSPIAAVAVPGAALPGATPVAAPAPAAGQAAAGLPGFEPAAPVKRAMSYRSVEVAEPYIALTFDDGPNPETTPKLLKMLADRNIKATFFVLGTNASAHPDVLRMIAAAGHEIGNHSWSHPQLPKLTVAAADKQIEDTSAAIETATGKAPIYLRPPYGAMTPALQHHIWDKYGLTVMYWSVDPLDWKVRDAQSIYDQIMKQVKPGSIVLAHDIHATTVAAMPRVLDALIAKGYKFATVSELIAMEKPAAPKVASATPAAAPAAPRKKPQGQAQAQNQAPQKPRPPARAATAAPGANNYGLY